MSRFSFVFKRDLSHRAISVYIYLSERANKANECWPAIPTIAKELRLSESTVRRAIRELKADELLNVEQRYRKDGGKSSLLYKLQIEVQTPQGVIIPKC